MLTTLYSGFDWALEIIDDGTNPDLNPAMISLVNSSVSSKTITKTDSLGFPYPGITPKIKSSGPVNYLAVRSVYSYKFGTLGYIVEIAVYREWVNGDMAEEPKIESSMSMYHPEWDWQMAKVFNTSKVREWDPQLNCFFGQECDKGGISNFLNEIIFLQGLLAKTGSA